MHNMKVLYIIVFAQLIFLSGCCFLDPDELLGDTCTSQVFEETKNVPLESVYTLNTNSSFVEANTLTASQIQSALKVEGSDFEIKRIEITSAQISYKRHPDNSAGALLVNIAVVGNTFSQLLLMKENLLLPLFDIPGTGFTDPININEYLSGPAIKELKKILLDYATILNDEGISFLLTGNPSPPGTSAHFDLKFNIKLTIVYEICRDAPIGDGIRECE